MKTCKSWPFVLVISIFCLATVWSPPAFSIAPIEVNTEAGGNIDTGNGLAEWDGNYENTNGAMFWNGSRWVTNDFAAHLYFTSSSTGQRLKEHQNTIISSNTSQLGEVSTISGVSIVKSLYSYSVERANPGSGTASPYSYQALQYLITQTDGTHIILRSRGSGNGLSQAYFDVYIEDGLGNTTALRGDPVWYEYQGKSALEAVNETDAVTGRTGRLCSYSATDPGENNYWMDINGGCDQGGVTYHMIVGTVDPATIPTKNLGQPFVVEFHLEYSDSQNEIQDIIFTPALVSESSILFEDSFSDKAPASQAWSRILGKWSLSKKGQYSCSAKKNCLANVSSLAASVVSSAEVRVKLLSKKPSKFNASLIFGLQNKKTYRYLTITPKKIIIGQEGDIGSDKKGAQASVETKLKKGKWYVIKINVFSDGSVQGLIDGVLAATAKFDTVASGSVGLASAKSATLFDDFVASGGSGLPGL